MKVDVVAIEVHNHFIQGGAQYSLHIKFGAGSFQKRPELGPKTDASVYASISGLWGSVHKQLWALTKDRSHLDEAVRAYERGFYLRNDYYNGINFAFLLNVRAASAGDVAEAIADFVQARRVRKEVIEICERWLEANPEPTGSEATEGALQKYQESKYWVLATLAEAYLGLGESGHAEQQRQGAFAVASADWMKETTQKQLDELRALLANSPLSRISAA